MDTFSKDGMATFLGGETLIGFGVVRTGKDALGKMIGTCSTLAEARDIQKASRASTIILKTSTKMVK